MEERERERLPFESLIHLHLLSFNFLKIDRITRYDPKFIVHRSSSISSNPMNLPFLEHRRCSSAFPCYSFASTVYESFVVDCALVASFPPFGKASYFICSRNIYSNLLNSFFFFYRWLKIILELFLSNWTNRFFLFMLRWRKQLVLGAGKNLTFLSKMTDKKKCYRFPSFVHNIVTYNNVFTFFF